MTQKQQTYHKSLVRSIHLSRRYKEYYKDNKDEYKELLQEHFKVDSSKELSIDQLILFVDYMNFKRASLPSQANKLCSEAQISKMKELWFSFARTPTEEKLLSFVNRQTSKDYSSLELVTKAEAQKIIPTLITMQKGIKTL